MGECETPDGDPLAGEELIFRESGGLYTEQRLESVHGTSPVEVAVGDEVYFTVHLGGGHVAAGMDAETAEAVAWALTKAADRLKEAEDGRQ